MYPSVHFLFDSFKRWDAVVRQIKHNFGLVQGGLLSKPGERRKKQKVTMGKRVMKTVEK